MNSTEWKSHVANIGCILCRHHGRQYTPACLHHIREGQGLAQRSSDWLVVPLCQECHQGANGFHGLGVRGFYTRYKLDELDLLAITLREAICTMRE